jgi:hypothetical protein
MQNAASLTVESTIEKLRAFGGSSENDRYGDHVA